MVGRAALEWPAFGPLPVSKPCGLPLPPAEIPLPPGRGPRPPPSEVSSLLRASWQELPGEADKGSLAQLSRVRQAGQWRLVSAAAPSGASAFGHLPGVPMLQLPDIPFLPACCPGECPHPHSDPMGSGPGAPSSRQEGGGEICMDRARGHHPHPAAPQHGEAHSFPWKEGRGQVLRDLLTWETLMLSVPAGSRTPGTPREPQSRRGSR